MGASGANPSQDKGPLSCSPCPSDNPISSEPPQILVVEDNKSDIYLIRQAISEAAVKAEIHVLSDGDRAIRFLDEIDSEESRAGPAMVILDINLPKRHGGEVLARMRQSPRCGNALVVVVTSSDSTRDRELMAQFGISAYFRKPRTTTHS